MKNLQDYMDLPYELLLIPDPEGGFAACYPELPGCLTVGETKAEAAAQAESAKQEWIMAALKEGLTIPEPKLLKEK